MTYSATDLSDDVFNLAVETGVITQAQATDPALTDNAELQFAYLRGGFLRLLAVRDAAEALLLKVQTAQQLDPELSLAIADLAKAYAALRKD
jgi:hypothetical protein